MVGGGVEIMGESFRPLPIDLSASWKGSIDDGWATFVVSRLAGGAGGAFLKLGSFGFGLGAEKKDESDFASFTAVAVGFASFFTAIGLEEDALPRAGFFNGGGPLESGGSFNFRFFSLVSIIQKVRVASLRESG